MNDLYNEQAEQWVLGTLLKNNNLYDKISDTLYPSYFAHDIHAKIFETISERIQSGKTVRWNNFDHLKDDPDFMNVGGKDYLVGLQSVDGVAFIDNAHIIRDYGLKRKIVDVANQALIETKTTKETPEIIGDLERSLFLLADKKSTEDIQSATKGMEDAVDWIKEIHSGNVRPLKTGLLDLDRTIKGLFPSRLYIIAARPGMGKTVLAVNMAEYASKTDRVLFFSLEMSRQELSMRIAARHTGIPVEEQPTVTDPKIIAYLRDSVKCDNLMIDQRTMGISQMALVARRLHRQGKIGAIFIDYVGLIPGDMRFGRTNMVTEITAECKRLAKEIEVPVVLLCQLNRQVEKQEDKRPTLADLRDSGSIEQDADVVMFIYREEYYLNGKQDQPMDKRKKDSIPMEDQIEAAKGKAEIIVAKNRQGQSKTVHVRFNGVKQFFFDEVA